MAYSQTLNLVTGDTLPELTLTLRDNQKAAVGQIFDENNSETWAPIDLRGSTVRLRMRALGSTTIKSTLICQVVDGINGKVTTNFPEGTLDTAGSFEGEIEITSDTGVQTVYDLIKFKVRSDFD